LRQHGEYCGRRGDEHKDREAVFAVAHAYEMLAALKKDYYAMWRGGKPRAPIDEEA
jgi:hypothetical protein